MFYVVTIKGGTIYMLTKLNEVGTKKKGDIICSLV